MAKMDLSSALLLISHLMSTSAQTTHSGTIICKPGGSTVSGIYNDSMLTFNIYVPNDGEMTIDATSSSMTYTDGSNAYPLIGMELLYPDNTLVGDGEGADLYSDYLILGIADAEGGERYQLYYYVGPGYPPPTGTTGTYDLTVTCSSLAPTYDPTTEPTGVPTTASPTADPTFDPTKDPTTSSPTSSPTAEPTTSAPTKDPTTHVPTENPTTNAPTEDPTTPAPTQPGSTIPGVLVTGDYNDAAVIITLILSDECDATLDTSSSSFSSVSVEITDSSGSVIASGDSPLSVDALSAGRYTVTLEGSTTSYVAKSDDTFGFICLCKMTADLSSSSSDSDSDSYDDDDTDTNTDSGSGSESDSDSD